MTTQVFRGIEYKIKIATGDNQKLKGTKKPDWLVALGGDNIVNGGQGDDVILAGVDFLGGFSIGDVPPWGGEGIILNNPLPIAGNNIIYAGAGNDFVAVGQGNSTVYLGSGNNTFDGTYGGNNLVFAGSGNDVIDVGGIGTSTINAGDGNNRVFLGVGEASIKTGSGNDLIAQSGYGFNTIVNYVIKQGGQPYTQSIDAGDGDNQIGLSIFGHATIKTGSGNDFVVAASITRSFLNGPVNSDSVSISTGRGRDTVITFSTKSLIKTRDGNDLFITGKGDDTIYAKGRNNVINLRGATIDVPNPLSDVLEVTSLDVIGGGKDTVYLDKGHNTVMLGNNGGFATIYGFGRSDRLDMGGLNTSFTRSGHDTLISAGGSSIGILKGYTSCVGLA